MSILLRPVDLVHPLMPHGVAASHRRIGDDKFIVDDGKKILLILTVPHTATAH